LQARKSEQAEQLLVLVAEYFRDAEARKVRNFGSFLSTRAWVLSTLQKFDEARRDIAALGRLLESNVDDNNQEAYRLVALGEIEFAAGNARLATDPYQNLAPYLLKLGDFAGSEISSFTAIASDVNSIRTEEPAEGAPAPPPCEEDGRARRR
jgi:hypothetical protein